MAVITHANPHHASSQPAQPGRHAHFSARRICLGMVLLCIGIAALALPLVRDALNLVQSQTHWKPLEHWLAQAPMASWLMMFVWGAAIPLVLLHSLQQTPSHKLRTVVLMMVLMWIAVTWYVHMPASNQCTMLYESWEWACSVLQWGFSMSLLLAIAAYAFLMLGLVISSLGQLSEGMEDEKSHAA